MALSTTLATNAVVEGKGCRIGLVLIGHEAVGNVPAHMTAVISGGHNIHGQEQAELDLAALSEALTNMKGKVEAIAVSGYLSIRNPEHELRARKLVQELLDLPVVCAHQLTTELGFQERTVTACLNARLLTVIAELLVSVRTVLRERGILAPMMVVKGDGSLMIHAPWGMEGFADLEEAEKYALEKTRGIILENVYCSGARAPEIVTDKEEVYIETPLGKVFIETRFALTAIGRPYWGE